MTNISFNLNATVAQARRETHFPAQGISSNPRQQKTTTEVPECALAKYSKIPGYSRIGGRLVA